MIELYNEAMDMSAETAVFIIGGVVFVYMLWRTALTITIARIKYGKRNETTQCRHATRNESSDS